MDDLYQELSASDLWVCQAKLNGRRAVWDGTILWSRQGNPLESRVVGALRGFASCLDGEFMNDSFFPFDLPDHPGSLDERWATLEWVVREIDSPFIRTCPLAPSWDAVVEHGWEGVVFKKRKSKYRKAMKDGVTTADWIKYRAEWL